MEPRQVKILTTRADLQRKVLHFAIWSRMFVLILSFVSNIVLPDHNAGVYLFPQPIIKQGLADQAVEKLFGGLARWDAQYFLHVSYYGYTYENTLAFFPMFPLFTRTIAYLLNATLGNILNSMSTVMISAVAVNAFFFVNAALKLFHLSLKILQDERAAYMSALFFCINPASIFFTAPYSESCFAFFTFSGMLFCIEEDNELLSSFALGLSSCARSNGVINFGYLVHKRVKSIFTYLRTVKDRTKLSLFSFMFVELYKLSIYVLVFSSPFLLFQGYAYYQFCLSESALPTFVKDYGTSKGFVMPASDSRPPWCNYTIPLSYSYVQNHYWNVGFLKYYQLKQIPNFLLALPVVFLVLSNAYTLILENKEIFISLGFNSVAFLRFHKNNLKPEFFVFTIHALFLTVFCVLFVHVQVTTRMIASSCPILYWFVALRYRTELAVSDSVKLSRLKTRTTDKHSMVETEKNMNSLWNTLILSSKPIDSWSFFVKVYFCSYVIVGTTLFSNFLPWT